MEARQKVRVLVEEGLVGVGWDEVGGASVDIEGGEEGGGDAALEEEVWSCVGPQASVDSGVHSVERIPSVVWRVRV